MSCKIAAWQMGTYAGRLLPVSGFPDIQEAASSMSKQGRIALSYLTPTIHSMSGDYFDV
jgi:hypothetical protein